jgi:tRNA (cytidine32/uridine32-2'-O)-methyltransferase
MSNFDNIKIVLVNTSHPGNIGASARSMKNMGLNELTLVSPENFPSGVAVGRAVSSIDILDRAVVVANLADAVADCGLVIGASARSRRIPWPMLTPSECANRVLKEKKSNKIALVFGREDSGLSNGELQQCNFHVQIPTSEEYTSLNLASAVMVVCYELRKAWLAMEGEVSGDDELWDIERATGEQLEHFYEHLERVLIAIEFHDPDNPRQLMSRLRRLFGRVRMDAMEMNIMRGILSNIEYHIKSSD